MTDYLLDTNVFIEAKNRHYGFDFCPAFWDWLVAQNRSGKVSSIEKVAKELHAGEDELTTWAKERGDNFFLQPDKMVILELSNVTSWVNSNGYQPVAIATFLEVADYWLVGHALAHNCTVVTHEVKVPNDNTSKIKIPNACIGLGLSCINPYEMLRREQARFVLGPGREVA